MNDEARARELLAATPHSPDCPVSLPDWQREGEDHCECDRAERAIAFALSDPRDDPAHPNHDAVCGHCGQPDHALQSTSPPASDVAGLTEGWLAELLLEHDPSCGYADCEHTASKLYPILAAHIEAREARIGGLVERGDDLELALNLALQWLAPNEPGDSRAVSNEFVAMASIQAGITERLDECRSIIRAALKDAKP